DPVKFRKEYKDKEDADRLLVTIGQSEPKRTDFVEKEELRLREGFDKEALPLTTKRAEAEKELEEARENPAYGAAAVALAGDGRFFDRAKAAALPVLGVALLLVGFVVLIVGVVRGSVRLLPVMALSLGGAVVVFAIVLVNVLQQGGRGGQVAFAPMAAKMEEQ